MSVIKIAAEIVGTVISSNAKIKAGSWYGDGWVSPFVRASFPVRGAKAWLKLSLFNPDSDEIASIAVRVGQRLLAVLPDIGPGQMLDWRCELDLSESGSRDEHGLVSISLRVKEPHRPTTKDERSLGVIVTEWNVTARQGSDQFIPAKYRPKLRNLLKRTNGSSIISDEHRTVSNSAQLFIAEYLKSSLFDQQLAKSLTGTETLYPEEFIDLFSLMNEDDRHKFLPIFDFEHYRNQVGSTRKYDDAGYALCDFFARGISERLSPHPLVDLGFAEFVAPNINWASPDEFWSFFERNIADPSPFFDVAHYSKSIERGAQANPSALFDFLLRGAEAGGVASPHIDVKQYRASHTDVPAGAVDALLHFVQKGDAELRKPGSDFDPEWYVTYYQGDSEIIERPLWHYLRYGRYAGRAKNEAGAMSKVPAGTDAAKAQAITYQPNSKQILSNYRDMDARRDRLNKRIDHVHENILPIRLSDFDKALNKLAFDSTESPEIDIVIPFHDEFELTVECLVSLKSSLEGFSYRVHLIDDKSKDPRCTRFADIPGVTYHANKENLHFLRSVNGYFPRLTGRYVLILNNDTQIIGAAIQRLFDAMNDDAGIGIAVPKFIFPNGLLQEAGCTILSDGTTTMVGCFDDANKPQFSYSRDILYGSGACILVRRNAVKDNLFDEAFAPAYCEDVDLCLRIRSKGWRIRYVADAIVAHHLSASTSKLGKQRRLRMVRHNQQILEEKWGEQLRSDVDMRFLAFYLPQFHPIPENDYWWGKGFTEWTNVARAQPSFVGHYQPHMPSDLGFYDLRLVETMEQQMRLARRYGISGFVMYYYNFQGRRILNTPLDNLIKRGDVDFNFCLCWANENWTKHWDGGSQKHALMTQDYGPETYDSLIADVLAAAELPGAIKIHGKPLFMIYRPKLIPNVEQLCDRIRHAFAKAGFPGVYLAYVESMELAQAGVAPPSMGFDASVEFPPQGVASQYRGKLVPLKSAFLGQVYDYQETVINAVVREKPAYKRFPGVFPSWDNTPRQPFSHTALRGATPTVFQWYVEQKMHYAHEYFCGDERLIFVNAWNEWAEGAHLEPDQRFGHSWLEALRNARLRV